MTIIYHSRDFDGLCSGKILQEKYPYAKCIGYDYGEPIPDFPLDECLIMADVTFPLPDMIQLAEQLDKNGELMIVIDHHISFAKQVEEYQKIATKKVSFSFIYDNSISACEAVWKYCYPEKDIPRGVELLGKYDTWRKDDEWDLATMPFQYALRSSCNRLDSFPSIDRLSSYSWINAMIHIGGGILDYQAVQNEKHCAELAFETDFKGLRAVCLNSPLANSQAFDSVWNEDKYDLMICFRYNGKTKLWVYSLYTTKDGIDCSELAKEMGGGGHKKAAGFQNEKFILNE